jgi:hypothetical protein
VPSCSEPADLLARVYVTDLPDPGRCVLAPWLLLRHAHRRAS